MLDHRGDRANFPHLIQSIRIFAVMQIAGRNQW